MRTPVEKALWFIESHFSRDITLDEVAGVCGLSRFQMSRLFSHALGTTVTSYVRGRRLTEAARALANGAPDILAVALKAGYGSHEAFSRAFRDQLGLTPTELRARGNLDGIALVEPLRAAPGVAVRLPPPRLDTPGPLLIAGIGRRFACDDSQAFPRCGRNSSRTWAKSRARKAPPPTGWSPTWRRTETAIFISPASRCRTFPISIGFTGMRLPAQRWAVFPHEGHITAIASTIDAVFAQALPDAGLMAGDMPDLLERYGESFDPRTGNGGCEIWVPVK